VLVPHSCSKLRFEEPVAQRQCSQKRLQCTKRTISDLLHRTCELEPKVVSDQRNTVECNIYVSVANLQIHIAHFSIVTEVKEVAGLLTTAMSTVADMSVPCTLGIATASSTMRYNTAAARRNRLSFMHAWMSILTMRERQSGQVKVCSA